MQQFAAPAAAQPQAAEVTPSKVLHLKPIPKTATQQEILNLFMPFCNVDNLRIFYSTNLGQAFVELPNINVAATALQQWRSNPPHIQGVLLNVEFSNRQSVTPSGSSDQTPNRLLLITVNNLVYQIDLDLIHSLFCKFGNILRMAIFNRPNKKDTKEPPTVQCLVEYARVEEAIQALQTLNGRCIYAGCNELEIQYSKLNQLTVRQNNERTRDFTNPNLPQGDEGPPSSQARGAGGSGGGGGATGSQMMGGGANGTHTSGGGGGSGRAAGGGSGGGATSAAVESGQTVLITNPFASLDAVQLAGLPAQQVVALHENLQRQVMLAQ
eukprot:Cvel_28311.t1-p1 / transcript=Cvel_28311.t1 / gene=Cvel_28311 / organism=Chromera_velia_CCMP2878 / gene_product=Polypyrimidine tract-binding protein homolog 3, putative / transcript_product=Polypyrimidine tract-binding protein homolog 3, putative / location=Cvel_scaffold3677:363-2321(-) / protein_length=324 / sequence_SO=supercontig / SO=protein_coding / is_pseudo=false